MPLPNHTTVVLPLGSARLRIGMQQIKRHCLVFKRRWRQTLLRRGVILPGSVIDNAIKTSWPSGLKQQEL